MENRYLEQICFDLQLDQQMLDQIDQMFDLNNGTAVHSFTLNSTSLHSFNTNLNPSDNNNKSKDAMESTLGSRPELRPVSYQTNDNLYLVPKFDPSVSAKASVMTDISDQCLSDIERFKVIISAKIDDYCLRIIREMNTIGVSVIDNLVGELGEFVSNEVWHLYQTVITDS